MLFQMISSRKHFCTVGAFKSLSFVYGHVAFQRSDLRIGFAANIATVRRTHGGENCSAK